MTSKSHKGYFVTLEGGEGAGKSSVGHRLQRILEEEGHQVVFTREPGSTPLGELIRHHLLSHSEEELSPDTETLLFLAARAQHLHSVIRPALADGKLVLCDRFNDSTIAYQGYGRCLEIERIATLCRLATGELEPHLTLLLDLDPQVGLERATRHAGHDRLEAETLAFHQRVRNGFLMLANQHPERIRFIDATQPIDDVVAHAYGEIKWNPCLEIPKQKKS